MIPAFIASINSSSRKIPPRLALIKKADGTKFGKTESGNLWLDPKRTSPYKFYQFWLNASDSDVSNYIRIFTLKNREEIESLEKEHALDPSKRILQKALAADITVRVHSAEDLQIAMNASEILFGKSTDEDLKKLDNETLLDIFEGVPQGSIAKAEIEAGLSVTDALVKSGFLASNGEAKRALSENSISVNKIKADQNKKIDSNDLLNGSFVLLQKGKKNYFLLKAE